MPGLTSITLSKLKVISRLSAATSLGLIVQMGDNGQDHDVAMRAAYSAGPNGNLAGWVILEGGSAGYFVSDRDMDDRPAIDISDLVEISLVEAAPQRTAMQATPVGSLFLMSTRTVPDIV